MDGKIFWKRAKPLIKAHNMTQQQFAQTFGVSINTLRAWIRYERVPETSAAYGIAVTLGVTLDYLLGGHETDIAKARIKELAARKSAAKIVKWAEQILKEAEKIRPL